MLPTQHEQGIYKPTVNCEIPCALTWVSVGLTMLAMGMSANARSVCRRYISNSSQTAAYRAATSPLRMLPQYADQMFACHNWEQTRAS